MRKLLIALAGATALTAASGASATTFTGSTLGCFGGGCTVANASAPPGSGISFTSGAFNLADSAGFLSIGTDATANSLGLISLTTLPSSWVNVPFSLQVSFTAPPGTSPSSTLYSALLNGSVSSTGCTGTATVCGGAQFVFSDPLKTFTFAGGTFSLLVNNLSVSPGATNVPLNGTIRVLSTAVPEPATWGLMLLGFGGIGMAMRRRRRPVLAQVA